MTLTLRKCHCGAPAQGDGDYPDVCNQWPICETPAPRRMVAVTIAISEPAGSPEINWPFLLSALVRTHFNSYAIGSLCEGTNCPHGIPCGNPVSPDVLDHDVIRVIDAWRADQ